MKLTVNGQDHKTRKVAGVETLVWSEEVRNDLIVVGNIASFEQPENITEEGTCVLGGGICVNVVVGNKRKATSVCIVEAPFQGNISNWKALEPVLNYIKENYPELNATYNEGRID